MIKTDGHPHPFYSSIIICQVEMALVHALAFVEPLGIYAPC